MAVFDGLVWVRGVTSDVPTVEAVPAEAFTNAQQPMPWGSATVEERNCAEAVGHGTHRAAIKAGQSVQGIGTLALGYNPDTGQWGDRTAKYQAWVGMGNVAVSSVVAVTFGRVNSPVKDVPWVQERVDVAATVWGSEIGYDHAAAKSGGDGWHKWDEDAVAMATEVAWTIVPAVLTGGTSAAVKSGAGAAGRAALFGAKGTTFAIPGSSWIQRAYTRVSPPLSFFDDFDKGVPTELADGGGADDSAYGGLIATVDDVPAETTSALPPVSDDTSSGSSEAVGGSTTASPEPFGKGAGGWEADLGDSTPTDLGDEGTLTHASDEGTADAPGDDRPSGAADVESHDATVGERPASGSSATDGADPAPEKPAASGAGGLDTGGSAAPDAPHGGTPDVADGGDSPHESVSGGDSTGSEASGRQLETQFAHEQVHAQSADQALARLLDEHGMTALRS